MRGATIFGASLIPLNALLLFFLLFDNRLVVPSWLQVLGRMHPVVLHFPIVLVILYAVWMIWAARAGPGALAGPGTPAGSGVLVEIADILLLTAAVSAAITAIMGIFLSKEPGYD